MGTKRRVVVDRPDLGTGYHRQIVAGIDAQAYDPDGNLTDVIQDTWGIFSGNATSQVTDTPSQPNDTMNIVGASGVSVVTNGDTIYIYGGGIDRWYKIYDNFGNYDSPGVLKDEFYIVGASGLLTYVDPATNTLTIYPSGNLGGFTDITTDNGVLDVETDGASLTIIGELGLGTYVNGLRQLVISPSGLTNNAFATVLTDEVGDSIVASGEDTLTIKGEDGIGTYVNVSDELIISPSGIHRYSSIIADAGPINTAVQADSMGIYGGTGIDTESDGNGNITISVSGYTLDDAYDASVAEAAGNASINIDDEDLEFIVASGVEFRVVHGGERMFGVLDDEVIFGPPGAPFQLGDDIFTVDLVWSAAEQKGTIRGLHASGFILEVSGHILPQADNAFDLGSPVYRWRHAYLADASLYLGSTNLWNDGGTLMWGAVPISGGGGGVTAHSALTGLDADDHAQYITQTELDASGFYSDPSEIDHGGLSGLTDDDHSIYMPVAATRGFSGTPYFTEQDITASGVTNIDWSLSPKAKISVIQNSTLTFSDPGGAANLMMRVVQEDDSLITTLPSILWPSGISPVLSSTSGYIDIVSLYFDGSTYYGNVSYNFG